MGKVLQQAPAAMTGSGAKLRDLCIVIWFAALLSSVIVEGAPILGPDLANCRPVIPPRRTAADSVDCCFIDTGKPIKDFKFNLDLPVRVRKPAHKLEEEFVRKYERAVELMRALPPHDPRSYEAQWKIHCAYCAAAYSQFNSSETLDVHHGWFVLPFHRWYLYFHERILASLIADDTFAIPYWAWDVQNESFPPANIMPSIYTNASSSLYDPLRSKVHQPPYQVDLNFFKGSAGNKDPEVLKHLNLHSLWRSMVGDVKTPEAFYGGKFAQGYKVKLRDAIFENGPHASVHFWTGDETAFFGEDMAPAYSAARDPLFFTHHSQIDRLWLMWKSFGGRDLDDPDWLDAEFLFYDENADMVRVNVRDSLDIEKFRVSYEQVPADWLAYSPRSIRDTQQTQNGIMRRFWREGLGGEALRNIAMALGNFFRKREENRNEILLGVGRNAVTTRVSRPEMIRSDNLSSVYDEVLAISGVVKKPFNVGALFNLFLELPEADDNTPHDCAEFLGGIKVESEGLDVGEQTSVAREFTRVIGIGDRLRILGISRQKSVAVTFVPGWDPEHDAKVSVRFTELRIEMRLVR